MKKVVVVLPAYNCEDTLKYTIDDIPKDLVHEILLVDDGSRDGTIKKANSLGIKHIYAHSQNMGYGANQKTCYDRALEMGADIIIMLHPDYQYDPKLIPEILSKFKTGSEIVFASRLQKGFEAVKFGMPLYKYIANKILTSFQNLCLGQNLSEYHTGYRAYSKKFLSSIDYHSFSNDFIFDNEIAVSAIYNRYNIDEIYCPAKYEAQSSSINFRRSLKYGLGVVLLTMKFCLKKYF